MPHDAPPNRHFVTDALPLHLAARLGRDKQRPLTLLPPLDDAAVAFIEGGAAVREDLRQSYAAGHGERTQMGRNPGGGVGPQIVMVLEGPASAYSILTDERGRAVLVRHGNIEGVLDPGKTLTGQRFVRDARQRAAAEQERNRAWASSISAFWARQQKRKTNA
jgi:hypothetical protein